MAKKQDDKEQEDASVEVAQSVIAYHYLSAMNPNGAFLPGVPLTNLTTDQVETYPQWIQDSIAGSPMYKSVAPKGDGKKE